MNAPPKRLALVLGGGGARAAYQVGFLRCLSRNFPDLRPSILTGVSAGAINAAHLANHQGTLVEAVDDLTDLWGELTMDQVLRVDSRSLVTHLLGWGLSLISGGLPGAFYFPSLFTPLYASEGGPIGLRRPIIPCDVA